MSRRWGVAGGLVLLVLIVVALPVVAVGSAFVGILPIEDGRTYRDGRVTTVFDTYVACFLVDAGDTYVLIDGCMNVEPVRAALAARGATLDDVGLVLLTHSHDDHVGVARELEAPVRALPEASDLLSGQASHLGPLPRLMGGGDTGIRIARPLTDGEVIQVGTARIEVFAVPGHTADSAAFLFEGILFLGDNITIKESGIVGAPWVFSDDTAQNVASVRALAQRLEPRAKEIRWLVPAHTGPMAGLEALAAIR